MAAIRLVQAFLTFKVLPARRQGNQGVEPKTVMVVQVLIAQREAENPLPEQRRERVLNKLGVPVIRKTGREAVDDVQAGIQLPKQ